MIIVGAGLSGLIAARAWPHAEIYEREREPRAAHKALLRFRGERVSVLVGIPFRRVLVRKAIWSGGEFVAPNIQLANQYSRKVLGRVLNDRSIWNLEPVERFIAPEDFHTQLVERATNRIWWDATYAFPERDAVPDPVVSTVPLPALLEAIDLDSGLKFRWAEIHVQRFRVADCDVFQTIYFPDPEHDVYRASITGNLLIIESICPIDPEPGPAPVAAAFGLSPNQLTPLDDTVQRYGKIAPTDDTLRRALIARISQQRNIYALGRFATWRNVLLDDLPHDIEVIKRLIAGDHYDARLLAAG